MTLPITLQRWHERQTLCKGWKDAPEGFCYSAEEAILWCAQWLIERLYTPCSVSTHPWGTIRMRHANKLTKPYDVECEPINWGDLHASVEQKDDVYVVTLEEAFPGECPNLCAYVNSWLLRWGWLNVSVETEW